MALEAAKPWSSIGYGYRSCRTFGITMHHHTYRRWSPPGPTRIPDIHGWLQDISSTREMARCLLQELTRLEAEPILVDALSTAALIRYSRCFTTGIRERLDISQLPSATDADREFHKRVRGIRDWHIAHPVNQQEAHALYVIIDEAPGATTGALGFSSQSSVDAALLPNEVEALLELCTKWMEWLNGELVAENLRLMPLANLLTRQQLLSLPQDEPQSNPNIRAKRRQKQL